MQNFWNDPRIFPIYNTLIHESLKWLRYNTRDVFVRNFCTTDRAIVTRLQATLSGARFPTGTRDFSPQLPNQAWSLPTFLFSVFCVPVPQFRRDKVVRLRGGGWNVSAGHRLLLRLRMIVTILHVPHRPAVTLITSLRISSFDFTSETSCVTYTECW